MPYQARNLPKNPYLQVVDQPRMMSGKGAPRSTVFGVLGRTVSDSPYLRTLGGLVMRTADAPLGKGTVEKSSHIPFNTERHTLTAPKATHVPGQHYGQIPYPGLYRSALGAPIS